VGVTPLPPGPDPENRDRMFGFCNTLPEFHNDRSSGFGKILEKRDCDSQPSNAIPPGAFGVD